MGYLEEFQLQLDSQQYTRFVRLWEEYCQADVVDGKELLKVLHMIKKSPFAPHFGEYTESILALWEKIEEPDVADNVLRLTLDIQTKNAPRYADLATEYLTKKYASHP